MINITARRSHLGTSRDFWCKKCQFFFLILHINATSVYDVNVRAAVCISPISEMKTSLGKPNSFERNFEIK